MLRLYHAAATSEYPKVGRASVADIFKFHGGAVIGWRRTLGKLTHRSEQIFSPKNDSFQSFIAEEFAFTILSFVYAVAHENDSITRFQFETVGFDFFSWYKSTRKMSVCRSHNTVIY